MKEFIAFIETYGFVAFMAAIAGAFFLFKFFDEIYSLINNKFKKYHKEENEKESDKAILEEHSKAIAAISDKIDCLVQKITDDNQVIKDGYDNLRKATIEQMCSSITRACEEYLERGNIEFYELQALMSQFEQYKAIGGNHHCELLVTKVSALPIVSKH